MSGIPFVDLLAEIERDPKETALALMEAVKVHECAMGDVLDALQAAASQSRRALDPVVVERQIGIIANGVRYADPAAHDAWIAENGPVLRSASFVEDVPDRLRGAARRDSSRSDGESADRGETMGNAFKKVAWTGGAAGIIMIGILLSLGEASIAGLSLLGIVTAFTVGYLAMYYFFGYSDSNRH